MWLRIGEEVAERREGKRGKKGNLAPLLVL